VSFDIFVAAVASFLVLVDVAPLHALVFLTFERGFRMMAAAVRLLLGIVRISL